MICHIRWYNSHSFKNDALVLSRIIPDVADLKIKREKICRQDTSFMKKVRLSSEK